MTKSSFHNFLLGVKSKARTVFRNIFMWSLLTTLAICTRNKSLPSIQIPKHLYVGTLPVDLPPDVKILKASNHTSEKNIAN